MNRITSTFFTLINVAPTAISFPKEIGKEQMGMRPPFAGRPRLRTVTVHRYVVAAGEGFRLPHIQTAKVALQRVMSQIDFDLRPLVTLGSNSRGGFLLEAPDDCRTESAVIAFMIELDSLIGVS